LRAFLFRRKDIKPKVLENKKDVLLGSNRNRPCRPPSDPGLNSTYAITILDSKGKSKTVGGMMTPRARTGSSGNCIGMTGPSSVLVGIHKNTSRATSHTSVDSTNTNTISNSSLQDLDETEYTGQELAGFMAELNNGGRKPNNNIVGDV
jgi:hypothetical protein